MWFYEKTNARPTDRVRPLLTSSSPVNWSDLTGGTFTNSRPKDSRTLLSRIKTRQHYFCIFFWGKVLQLLPLCDGFIINLRKFTGKDGTIRNLVIGFRKTKYKIIQTLNQPCKESKTIWDERKYLVVSPHWHPSLWNFVQKYPLFSKSTILV